MSAHTWRSAAPAAADPPPCACGGVRPITPESESGPESGPAAQVNRDLAPTGDAAAYYTALTGLVPNPKHENFVHRTAEIGARAQGAADCTVRGHRSPRTALRPCSGAAAPPRPCELPRSLACCHRNLPPQTPHPTAVGAACIVGEETRIAEKCSVKKSVLGRRCRLGIGAKVVNSVIMDGAWLPGRDAPPPAWGFCSACARAPCGWLSPGGRCPVHCPSGECHEAQPRCRRGHRRRLPGARLRRRPRRRAAAGLQPERVPGKSLLKACSKPAQSRCSLEAAACHDRAEGASAPCSAAPQVAPGVVVLAGLEHRAEALARPLSPRKESSAASRRSSATSAI